jgi:hypothetical protein
VAGLSHESDLRCQFSRDPRVVGVEKGDEITPSRVDPGVARGGRAFVHLMANAGDTCAIRPKRAGKIIGRAVVDDDDFQGPSTIRDLLGENAVDRSPDHVGTIPDWNYYRDNGHWCGREVST